MFPRSTLSTGAEDGYSLIGLLVALPILALMTTGMMVTIFQVHSVSSDRTNHMVAVREVQNVGHWITRDGKKAAIIELTQDPDGFPLTMSWDDQDDNQHEVVYTLLPDNKLQREHYTNRSTNPVPDATTLVAQFIDPSSTSCDVTANDELVANITAVVNISGGTHTETRAYRILPRRSMH